jgi:integrase
MILETGMRPSEIFQARWEDIKFQIGFLQVAQGKTLFVRRIIPLTKPALKGFSRRVSEATTDLMFPFRKNPDRPIG